MVVKNRFFIDGDIFFYKQMTVFEFPAYIVGTEMCIEDRLMAVRLRPEGCGLRGWGLGH